MALSPLLVVPCFGMATQFLTITVEAIVIKADWDGVIVHPYKPLPCPSSFVCGVLGFYLFVGFHSFNTKSTRILMTSK